MLRCLRLPAWRVSGPGRRALVELCEANDVPLFDLVTGGALATLTPDDAAAAQRCTNAITELNGLTTHEDARSIFHRAMEEAEYYRAVLELERHIERMQAGANLNKFDDLLENFTGWTQDHRVSVALRYLPLLRDSA